MESGKVTTNMNVGIGTASPTACVHVQGTLSQPLTGSVSVTQGDSNKAAIGVSTLFTTELAVGDALKVGTDVYTVAAIADDTHLTLDKVPPNTASGQAFTDPTLLNVENGAGSSKMQVTKTGQIANLLDVAGSIHASGDVQIYGVSQALVINVRTMVTKTQANSSCPSGTAVVTPLSYRGKTGSRSAPTMDTLHTTCTAVKYVYVTALNNERNLGGGDLACTAPVPYPWPWGVDYGLPDTTDTDWGNGDTYVVCCK